MDDDLIKYKSYSLFDDHDIRSAMKTLDNEKDMEICIGWLSDMERYNFLIRTNINLKKSNLQRFDYFSHQSLYMFLYCISFLFLVPTFSSIDGIRIYVVLSALSMIYIVVLYWWLRKFVNPYFLAVIMFIILLSLSLALHRTMCNEILFRLLPPNNYRIIALILLTVVMSGFLIHALDIFKLSKEKEKIPKLYNRIEKDRESRIKRIISDFYEKKGQTLVINPDDIQMG